MLPFVRMLEYGNVRPVGEIKKISAGIRHVMLLRTNGDLYSTGLNSLGQGGVNDKSIDTKNKWNRTVLNNVKDIICGGYSSLAITTDNKVFMCGRTAPLGNGYTATEIYETWTEVSNLFTQFNLVSVKIYMASGYISVLDGTTLYSLGNYANNGRAIGSGLTSLSRTFVQVATGVVKYFSCDYPSVSFFIDSSGGLWGNGNNSYGTLGNSTTTDIFPFTKLPAPEPILYLACNVQQGATFFGNTSMYYTGSNAYGGTGIGSTTGFASGFTRNPYKPSEMVGSLVGSTSLQVSPGITLVAVGDTIWETGYDNYGAGGTGSSSSNIVFYTKLGVQPNVKNPTITTTQYTSYIWNETEMWASGDPESLPSLTNYFSFTKLQLPWS